MLDSRYIHELYRSCFVYFFHCVLSADVSYTSKYFCMYIRYDCDTSGLSFFMIRK